ncbi:hypothetical protein PFISCL1PPCAC_20031, partial [Pristionchus fissidentatus]
FQDGQTSPGPLQGSLQHGRQNRLPSVACIRQTRVESCSWTENCLLLGAYHQMGAGGGGIGRSRSTSTETFAWTEQRSIRNGGNLDSLLLHDQPCECLPCLCQLLRNAYWIGPTRQNRSLQIHSPQLGTRTSRISLEKISRIYWRL